MRIARLVPAALLSPLAVPLLFFLASVSFSGYPGECCGHLEKLVWLTITLYTIMSYVFSFALGVPLVLMVRWRDRETMKIYLILAAALGAIAGSLFFFTTARPFYAGVLLFGVAGAVCGVVVSATFCLIAGIAWRPREDKLALPLGPRS